MLAVLLLTLSHGCQEGSRFEDCEEYIQCLANPPNCTDLVVAGPGHDVAGVAPSFNITGMIPSAIGSLTALTTLAIAVNGVSGTIPETIGRLTHLQFLLLASAAKKGVSGGLSGTLPPLLGDLPRLEKLFVYQTQISGTLPPVLGGLAAMQVMVMLGNSFTGVIPETFCQLSNLNTLELHDNHLSGTISDTFGELTALTQLALQNNHLSGTVPSTFSALTSLEILQLQNNSFTAVGIGICAIQDQLTNGCDLSENEIPGNPAAKGGKKNCPTCLNNGRCDKHISPGPHNDQPIFPNKACTFPTECTCWVRSFSPTPAPISTDAPTATTATPTMPSHASQQWEKFETTMCFGYTNTEAPHCGEIMLIVLLAAVFVLLFIVVYESCVISRHALRESKLHGTLFKETLGPAFTYRCCWCYTQRGRGREEHEHRATAETEDMRASSSTLEAPFLLDNVVAAEE